MNRNTIFGLLMIGAIFIGWSILMQPSKEELQKQKRKQDSILRLRTEQQRIDSLANIKAEQKAREILEKQQAEKAAAMDSPEEIPEERQTQTKDLQKFGDFSASAMQEDAFYTLENDLIKMKLSNQGGRVYSVELKKYQTYDSLPLILFDSDTSIFGFAFFNQSRALHTDDLYFQPHFEDGIIPDSKHLQVSGKDSLQFSMRLYPNGRDAEYNPDKYIEYLYTLYGDKYMVGFSVNLVGVNDLISTRLNTLDLEWQTNLRKQEQAVDRWNQPTVYYMYSDEDVDYLSGGDEREEEALKTRVKWISYKQHFFAVSLVAGDYFENADVASFVDPNPSSEEYLKSMYSVIGIPYNNQSYQSIPMSFYFGPLKYNILKKYKLDLEKQIPLGWSFFLLAWINIYVVIPVFDFLGSFGWNYGIVILVLTVLLKIVLFPIAYKTYMSSAKMRALKPEIDEINKKYPKKEDAMKKQQATMGLYKQAGVNPLAGCIPMLLQMPILFAMFRFFPSSIELRQQSFLWAEDLSTYDSIWTFPGNFSIPFYGDHVSLFTLLMTVSTIIYTKLNNQMMSSSQQMPGMKTMMYIMPVMFLGIFNNYSAALSYYYFLANVITFAQMYVFRAFVNEDKLRLKIQEAKKKPKKKSGFQKRLEEAAKKRGYKPPKR
ncbi:MAG: membrane protein insertase YidC [Bacteroidales bacterium]|nr:membrane protein insertase YidC [Bacteroidales bacterium]MCF8399171.1 membrane protein insertase YidC [Bacteroidales bacterium]